MFQFSELNKEADRSGKITVVGCETSILLLKLNIVFLPKQERSLTKGTVGEQLTWKEDDQNPPFNPPSPLQKKKEFLVQTESLLPSKQVTLLQLYDSQKVLYKIAKNTRCQNQFKNSSSHHYIFVFIYNT